MAGKALNLKKVYEDGKIFIYEAINEYGVQTRLIFDHGKDIGAVGEPEITVKWWYSEEDEE